MESDERFDERAGIDSTGEQPSDLAVQVKMLAEENQRLRTEYTRAQQVQYRRSAFGLAALGLLAAGGAIVFPNARSILFALAGTGLFASVLTYYLKPQRLLSAGVSERVFAATAATSSAIVTDLDLQDTQVYVPTGISGGEQFTDVRLFIPEHGNYSVPPGEKLTSSFVVTDDERSRGLSFYPTGAALFREYELHMRGSVSNDPTLLAEQLADAVVEGFELADSASVDVNPDDMRITIGIRGSTYGSADLFDHPIASFVATGIAKGLDTPVTTEQVPVDDERFEYLISCEWSGTTDE
ncbi:hypothetical protein [Haladaptatus sp. DFWS20]|uniref:hypothetical protein n=1 Tax=Haladaptatus sp. DFWS20 TaxID=3403467 RepID=UPI003EB8C383